MLEHRTHPLLPRRKFLVRQAQYTAAALALISLSLLIGILGYHFLENMAWIDAFLNAAMIMGGMGPIGELHTAAGKLFAGLYALYCGLVLLVCVGILFAPLAHRLLHRFHLEFEAEKHRKNQP